MRGDRRRIRAELPLGEVVREPGRRRVTQRVRPVCVVGLNRAQEHVHATLAGTRDEIVEQIEVIVDDEIAGAVGVLPIAPQREAHPVPAHAREVRHVVVDHLLPIGAEIAGSAIVGGRRQDVIRAEQPYLAAITPPAYDALLVEIHRSRCAPW